MRNGLPPRKRLVSKLRIIEAKATMTTGKFAAALIAIAFLLFGPVSACAFMPAQSASGHPCCPEKSAPPDDCTGQSCCAAAPAAPSIAVVNVEEWSAPTDFAQTLATTAVLHEFLSERTTVAEPAPLERYLTFHQLLV
jgi:hypothetical protein